MGQKSVSARGGRGGGGGGAEPSRNRLLAHNAKSGGGGGGGGGGEGTDAPIGSLRREYDFLSLHFPPVRLTLFKVFQI